MAAATVPTKTLSPMDTLMSSLDESKRNAMRTAGLAAVADSVYITKDGSITGTKPTGSYKTLASVDDIGVFKKDFVRNTIYKVFAGMFTFLPPETDVGIRQVQHVFADLHRAGVTLRKLMSLPPGNYISIKSPTTKDRIYFYRSMTDSGKIYFYSGIGKTGTSATMEYLAKRGLGGFGAILNRYGKTNISPDNDTLRAISRSFIQVHTDIKDIPAGRHTRRRSRRTRTRKTRTNRNK